MTTEEELQHKLERGLSVEDSLDAQSYRKVFEVLKHEPTFQLPVGFADGVVSEMNARKRNSYDHFWLGVGILIFPVAALVSAYLTGFKLNMGPFKFLSGYNGIILFGIGLIVAIQLLDRKMTQKRLDF